MTVIPIPQLLFEIDLAQLQPRRRRSIRGLLFRVRLALRLDRGGIAW